MKRFVYHVSVTPYDTLDEMVDNLSECAEYEYVVPNNTSDRNAHLIGMGLLAEYGEIVLDESCRQILRLVDDKKKCLKSWSWGFDY